MNKHHVILVGLFILLFCGPLFSGAEEVFIGDVCDSPQKYHNLQIQIRGEVVQVQTPPNPQTRGYYVMIDNSDRTIRVVANTLPAPEKKYIVNGIVQIDTTNQTPFIREVSRVEVGAVAVNPGDTPISAPVSKGILGLSPTVIALIALILIIIIVLLIVLFKKPSQSTPTAATPPVQPVPDAAPAKPAAPQSTRQVSTEEVERHVGGFKTKEVPNILAEVKVLSGSQTGKSFPLGYETTIGRIIGDVVLEDSSVSREHAKIFFKDNKYYAQNLSKTNPIVLNGNKLDNQKELKSGDEIVLGVIKLKFNLI